MTMSTAHSVSPDTAKAQLGALIEESLAREAAPDTAVRLEVPIAPVNAVAWLQAQGPQSRGYWRNRNGNFELAGIGNADMITAEVDADYDAIFGHLQRHIAFPGQGTEAIDDKITEGLDHPAGGAGTAVTVQQDDPGGGHVQAQAQQGRHQQDRGENRKVQRAAAVDHGQQHHQGKRDVEGEQHVQHER